MVTIIIIIMMDVEESCLFFIFYLRKTKMNMHTLLALIKLRKLSQLEDLENDFRD